ncbi:hypothetical protein FACS1894187_22930 [Synergistales bacterium]|nr:hypothetical protein FACS1894187_22930 [Synergistales bacterium]
MKNFTRFFAGAKAFALVLILTLTLVPCAWGASYLSYGVPFTANAPRGWSYKKDGEAHIFYSQGYQEFINVTGTGSGGRSLKQFAAKEAESQGAELQQWDYGYMCVTPNGDEIYFWGSKNSFLFVLCHGDSDELVELFNSIQLRQ